MRKHDTKKLQNGKVIHSVFRGEIDQFDMMEAIKDWSRLLREDHAIRFLVFDFTKTVCSKLSSNDLQVIARHTAELITIRKNLIMVGVMRRELDFGLFRMWETFMDFGHKNIESYQTHIVKNFDEAQQYIDELHHAPMNKRHPIPSTNWLRT